MRFLRFFCFLRNAYFEIYIFLLNYYDLFLLYIIFIYYFVTGAKQRNIDINYAQPFKLNSRKKQYLRMHRITLYIFII